MQSFVVFLTLLVGTALANPMAVTSDDLKQQNREISSKEYLKRVFQGSDVALVGRDSQDIVEKLNDLGLREAATIAMQVDLRSIIRDGDVSSVTLCMPSDKAVQKWRQELPESLRPDKEESLKNLVKAWIIPERIASTEIRDNEKVQSLNGAKLRFNIYRDGVKKVLTVNGAPIVEADVTFAQGLIQVVDKVIYPLPVGDVIETLRDNFIFSVFVDFVRQANLVNELESDPITVLVPTIDAFLELPMDVVNDLDRDSEKLRNVLKYHVISDVRYSASLSSGQRIQASNGNDIFITRDNDDQIFLNTLADQSKNPAKVIERDIPTTNGVIHVVDRVLLPPQKHFILV
ncbi:periostin-like [Lytechinus pictus]|uniref:periostin-like n=1 Tax=Lytechinus pictus TaxID=7653 RepID=UPI0030BA0D06